MVIELFKKENPARSVTILVTADQYRRLRMLSVSTGRSVSDILRRAIIEFLKLVKQV